MKISIEQLCLLNACFMPQRICNVAERLGRFPDLTELIDITDWLESSSDKHSDLRWLFYTIAESEFEAFTWNTGEGDDIQSILKLLYGRDIETFEGFEGIKNLLGRADLSSSYTHVVVHYCAELSFS